MKNHEFQHVSDLVDEQAAENGDLLAEISADSSLSCCWRRYHLIGDALRMNLASTTHRNFPENVMHALAKEPPIHLHHKMQFIYRIPAWSRRAAGMALAASIAILVITLVPSRMMQSPDPVNVAQIANPAAKVVPQIASSSLSNSSPVFMTVPRVSPSTGEVQASTSPVSDLSLAVATTDQDADIYIPPLYGIDQYVVHHSAAVSLNQTLPYARIVGYLSEK